MLDGLKSRLNGNQGRRKRYASEDAEEAQLSDAADPETFEDETQKSIIERIAPYRWYLLVLGIVLSILAVAI